MQRLRVGEAARSGAPARVVEFPGRGLEDSKGSRAQYLTGVLALLLHGALISALVVATWFAPELEEIIPIERVEEAPEQAPAPRVLAEHRAVEFTPQAAAVAPQIVDPQIVPQTVPTDVPQIQQIEPVAAPVAIDQTQILARRVSQVATANTVPTQINVPIDPAVKTVQQIAPHGNVGPRQIVSAGESVGTVVSNISGTAVKEGIASNRDVLGSPRGTTVANVNSRVGDSFLIGDGTGSGLGAGEGDCYERPEVKAYWQQIRTRMYARWVVPPDARTGVTVKLRFKLDTAGSASGIEVIESTDPSLGASALDALRAASPFDPMSDRVRCLARSKILATFQLTASGG